MAGTPLEVAVTTVAFYGAWVVGVATVYALARREAAVTLRPALAGMPVSYAGTAPGRWTGWNHRLWEQWQPAAVLAGLYFTASLVLGRLNPIAIGVFCQALVGLAVARSIPGFEALPIVRAIREHKHVVRAVLLMIVLGAVANVAAKVLGGAGLGTGAMFGEHDYTRQAASSFHVNAFQAFFALLGGGGVAEEVMFRLLGLTIVWKLTGKAWMGVIAGAILFAAYHFTPLDGLYRTFWQFPIGALASNVLVGGVWGILYVKRGLETAIAGHTLLDWFTFVAFVR
jgi:hypothetical protein